MIKLIINTKTSEKFYFAFLIMLFVIINAEETNASLDIAYICKDNVCVQGETATWHVSIYNNAKNDLELVAIELLNTANNTMFASLKLPFNPLSDKRGNLIVVRQNENVTINLTGELPKANYGNLLIFYSCFTTTIRDSYLIALNNKHESRWCDKTNYSMQIFECISDNNCNKDEFCSFNKCSKLKCKNCQYIKDNTCIDYQCCNSGQCKFDEVCSNNTCKKLGCKFNEYILNNTCLSLNCAYDEFIVNDSCKRLKCSFDEFALNHTCSKLACSGIESIENHTCKLLKCREDEHAKAHACTQLVCSYNETFFNHTCKSLNCWFFQDAVNHNCLKNKSVIFKLSMEIIAVIVIILFFILDFIKYEKKHKQNKLDKK